MLHLSFLRIATALVGIVFFIFATACSKKEDVAPAGPTTGRIVGTLRPVGAASTVTATGADGRTQAVVPDATTGAYAFADLAPGAYQLSAVPVVGFNQPDALPLTVKAGTTSPASLALVRDGRIRGTFSWEQHGSRHTATVLYGTILANTFTISASEQLGGGISQSINLSLPSLVPNGPYNFAGIGTYPLGLSQWTSAGCTYAVPNQTPDYYTTEYARTQVGQVVVTGFSMEARTVAGTFGFEAQAFLVSTGTPPATETISNGRFDITF